MLVIIGPSFDHCEALAVRIGLRRRAKFYHGADGTPALFLTDPARLEQVPRSARIFDAFSGVFNHDLAARFAAVLRDFDQYRLAEVNDEAA